MNVSDAVERRISVRAFKPDPVPDELINKILRAGISAANGGNNQRWRFLVIKDQKAHKALPVTKARKVVKALLVIKDHKALKVPGKIVMSVLTNA